MARLFLDPKKIPAGTEFPATFELLISDIAKYIGVSGLGSFGGISNGSGTPAVSDQDKPWWKLNGSGQPVGWHYFNGSDWVPFTPVGSVQAIHGDVTSTLPPGWVICDGTGSYTDINGNTVSVPDLRNKFIRGAGNSYPLNGTGGSNTGSVSVSLPASVGGTALSIAQMPAHNHGDGDNNILLKTDGTQTVGDVDNTADEPKVGGTDYGTIQSQGSGQEHSHTLGGSATGTADTVPEYYALYYIIYTAI